MRSISRHLKKSSINVVSDKETLLITPGGEIMITFPAGAVLSDAQVTVSPYSHDLPRLPTGATGRNNAVYR